MFGIVSALLAASCWTYACYLWRQQTKDFSAPQINIIKNIIAILIFSPVIATLDFEANFNEIGILLLSGIVGIALGDTFYIIALKKIGTRRTLTIEAISPIIATILGSFLLNETLPLKVWLGVLMVSISLIGVALQQTKNYQYITSNLDKQEGFFFAFLSVLCAVIGGTLSRFVLTNSNLNPFHTTEIRLFGGVLALLPFIKVDLINSIRKLAPKSRTSIFYATFMGTNIGILLQQNVFKLLPIGLGWTLLSTSPLMALFFARAEGEELDWKTFLLSLTTILGIGIVFL